MISKILVVDDSLVSRKIMRSCLPKDQGYEVFEAANGQEGVEQYKAMNPCVTFMDLTMPVMDGMEALRLIRDFDDRAVVIVCSADVQIKTISRVLSMGAFMMVKKPITREAIHDALLQADVALAPSS